MSNKKIKRPDVASEDWLYELTCECDMEGLGVLSVFVRVRWTLVCAFVQALLHLVGQ